MTGLNLCKKLEYAIGEQFYCRILGYVILVDIEDDAICLKSVDTDFILKLDSEGKCISDQDGECMLLPYGQDSSVSLWYKISKYIPKDTLVVCKSDAGWSIKYYHMTNYCFNNGLKSTRIQTSSTYTHIVRLCDFDFTVDNLDWNKSKSICI